MKAMESTVKSVLDPTPKHECHVSKNANKVTSLLAYRAYELTQVKLRLCYLLTENLHKHNFINDGEKITEAPETLSFPVKLQLGV